MDRRGLSALALGLYTIHICSYNNPELTLTYFMAMSNLVFYALNWRKLLGKTFYGQNLLQITRVTKENKNSDRGASLPLTFGICI